MLIVFVLKKIRTKNKYIEAKLTMKEKYYDEEVVFTMINRCFLDANLVIDGIANSPDEKPINGKH